MRPTEQQRRERVANGSRRKRDLAAVEPSFDFDAFITQHFSDWPEFLRGYPRHAAVAIWLGRHKAKPPTPAEVNERLEKENRTLEQLKEELRG